MFEFYVEHAPESGNSPYPTVEQPLFDPMQTTSRTQSKHGFFNVDPLLKIQKRTSVLDSKAAGGEVVKEEVVLPQDGIVLQSFISKWAGSLSEWQPHLDLARKSGYNMLHFVPMQVRGESNSPYSLADQLDFSPDLFDKNAGASKTREERFNTVQRWLGRIAKEWGILSMTDIVLNHTANNTPWLYAHPEAGKLTVFPGLSLRTERNVLLFCSLQSRQLSSSHSG